MLEAQPSQAQARFRGVQLDLDDDQRGEKELDTAWLNRKLLVVWKSCDHDSFSRADVLRFLPILLDKDNKPTGKRLVNSSDSAANGFTPHTWLIFRSQRMATIFPRAQARPVGGVSKTSRSR